MSRVWVFDEPRQVAPGEPLDFRHGTECRSRDGVIDGIHNPTSPWKENRMHASKLGTMVAILATAAGFSALAATR